MIDKDNPIKNTEACNKRMDAVKEQLHAILQYEGKMIDRDRTILRWRGQEIVCSPKSRVVRMTGQIYLEVKRKKVAVEIQGKKIVVDYKYLEKIDGKKYVAIKNTDEEFNETLRNA